VAQKTYEILPFACSVQVALKSGEQRR